MKKRQEKDMKKVLKYIIVVLLLGSIAAWVFLPVMNLGEDITLLELMKTGFGYYYDSYVDPGIRQGYIYIYFSPLSWWIAAFGILALLELFFVVVLKNKPAYIIAFICSLLDCTAAALFLWAAENQLSQWEEQFTEIPGEAFHYTGQVYIVVIVTFLGIYTLVMLLSLLGIWLCGRADRKAEENYAEEFDDSSDIYPEDFGYGGGDDAEGGMPGYSPVGSDREEASIPADVLSGGGFSNPYSGDIPGNNEQKEFHGAVLGENSRFLGKAYPLKYEEESYFVADGPDISMSDLEGDTAVAAVYYAEEYAEYCIRPLRRMSVFLESGQPLGKDRIYYIPRGMRIQVWNGYPDGVGNIYTLA